MNAWLCVIITVYVYFIYLLNYKLVINWLNIVVFILTIHFMPYEGIPDLLRRERKSIYAVDISFRQGLF